MRVDEALKLIPELDELRPLVREVVAASEPDPDHTWAGSGELGTFGRRTVQGDSVEERGAELARREAHRVEAVLAAVAGAIRAFADGAVDEGIERLLEAADVEERAARHDRVEAYALAAERAAREADHPVLAARALGRAARAARGGGRLAVAAERYGRAFEDARALGDERVAVVSAIGRGNVAVDRGRWSEAETWYRQALEFLNGDGTPRPERWQVCQNLSIVAREQGDYDEARRWLERAESLAELTGDADADVDVNNGWGQLRLAMGEPRLAEHCFRRALVSATSALARTVVSVNLADCLLAQGRVLEAAELAREAEAAALLEGANARLPEVYRLLGAIAAARGSEDAFVFFERGLEVVDELGLPAFERALTLEAYGRWRAEHQEPGEAAGYLREAAALFEEIGIEGKEIPE